MAKKLRDIAGKGQFSGVRKSTVAPPDIDDKNLYQWNAKDGVAFIKKHDTETHDYPYDAEAAFKGRKGGGSKTTKYNFQKDGVYEESEEKLDEKYMGFQKTEKALVAKGAKNPSALAAWIGRKKYGKKKFQAAAAAGKKLGEEVSCNHTESGIRCEIHGESACPTGIEPKDMPKKGQKVLMDKDKKIAEGRIEDDAQRRAAKELAAIAASSKKPVTKLKPGKKSYNQLKSTGQMFGGARSFAAGLAKRDIESGERGSSVGKAKLKEEDIQEVAPPDPKIEKWIKSNKERFVKEYGKEKGMQVLYAKAWKMHGQAESGTATNTDYIGTGAAGWTTGRLDVGTL